MNKPEQPTHALPPMPQGYPPVSPQHLGAPLPVLVQIGDITCTSTTVATPSGTIPIDQVFWNATDSTREDSYTPGWAIVAGVLTIWLCLLGLIFFFTKNVRMVGYIQVTVQGPQFFHSVNIPAGYGVPQDVFARVNYARGLTAFARDQRPA